MGKFVPPGSQVAVVAGMLDTEDHRKKTDGFSEAFPQHCAGGKIFTVIEGHEDEDESFQKTFELLRRAPNLAGLYVNTVNCLPVCRALGAHGLAGKVKLITTDLFAEMAPYFQRGIITASIYQQPHRQGQMAVRLMADHLTNKVPFPAYRAPQSRSSNVIQLEPVPRDEDHGIQVRSGSDPRARRFVAWVLTPLFVASWRLGEPPIQPPVARPAWPSRRPVAPSGFRKPLQGLKNFLDSHLQIQVQASLHR